MSEPRTLQILRAYSASGQMTVDGLIANHGMFGLPYRAKLRDTLNQMATYGTLSVDNHSFSITTKGRGKIAVAPDPEEPAPPTIPRAAPVFRQLVGYDAAMRLGRDLRDIGAMTTGVSPNPWRVPT